MPPLQRISYEHLVRSFSSLKISVSVTALVFLFFISCEASKVTGQIPSRTQFPPLLLFLQIPSSAAVSLERGGYYFSSYSSYSNTSIKKTTEDYAISIDLESLRLSQNLYYGLSDSLTVGAELPLLYFWKGAMDGFITNVHGVLGMPPKNDQHEKNNIYSYIIETDDFTINNRGKNVSGIGDISLFASKRVTSVHHPLQATITGAVKLPTGKREYLHGSGKTDFGMGAYLGYKFMRTHLHSFSTLTLPGTPEDLVGIKITPFFTESFTVAYEWSKTFSLVMQVDFNSNPFPEEIKNLGHSALELITGFKKNVGKGKVMTLSLTEDMTNHTTPDFSINIGFSGVF